MGLFGHLIGKLDDLSLVGVSRRLIWALNRVSGSDLFLRIVNIEKRQRRAGFQPAFVRSTDRNVRSPTEGGFSNPPLPFDWRTGMSALRWRMQSSDRTLIN